MRTTQITRHIGGSDHSNKKKNALFKSAALHTQEKKQRYPVNPEFSHRDYIAYLLSIDAEIEHCLMVQYLYAGYSLGGSQVPTEYRDVIRNWQEVILGIAKEEMGHLMSIQNSLRLIGAPLHLEREDYPWDVPFYPFPFALEPLTLNSLAKYVYAESPENWNGGVLGDEIRARVFEQTSEPHHVSELFNTLIPLVQDPTYLSDDTFDANTYSVQANWAEWGRSYQGGKRGNSQGKPVQTPNVLVEQQTCRDDMVAALQAVAYQGEATQVSTDSHFVRFLTVYIEMRELFEGKVTSQEEWNDACPENMQVQSWKTLKPGRVLQLSVHQHNWSPSRNVATNPYVSFDSTLTPELQGTTTTRITHPEAILWAQLHNLRYRMLLTYLMHSFTIDGGLNAVGATSPRGTIINATFGEMYNLRAISEILMQLPVSATDSKKGLAGPPFQMPYTLNNPFGEKNRWRAHLDLLSATHSLIKELLVVAPITRHSYLNSMCEADDNLMLLIQRILSGSVDTALL